MYKRTWAMLLNKIFVARFAERQMRDPDKAQSVLQAVDPLLCPSCGSKMIVTSVITKRDIIYETLSAMNMLDDTGRGPPVDVISCDELGTSFDGEIESVPFDDGWSYAG